MASVHFLVSTAPFQPSDRKPVALVQIMMELYMLEESFFLCIQGRPRIRAAWVRNREVSSVSLKMMPS